MQREQYKIGGQPAVHLPVSRELRAMLEGEKQKRETWEELLRRMYADWLRMRAKEVEGE